MLNVNLQYDPSILDTYITHFIVPTLPKNPQ